MQRAALTQLQTRLFQAMVNPDKTPTEDVALALKAWEATVAREETECERNIQRYLEYPHADRLTYATQYETYKQELNQAYQAYESSTLADHLKTRRAYLTRAQKPEVLLRAPSSVYTMLVGHASGTRETMSLP